MIKSAKVFLPSIALVALTASCIVTNAAASTAHPVQSHHQSAAKPDYHLGPITPTDLLTRFKVFAKNKAADQTPISDLEVQNLANHLNHKNMVVVFGTWCHDSQREIPRLLNLLDKVNAQHADIDFDIEFIAAAPSHKRDKALIEKYHITSVPTIMLFDKGAEQGRVVEHTELSLAADIVNMKL